MLNIYEKEKVYHDEFTFYFDRGKYINVFFSFNFINLIKDSFKIDDSAFLSRIKNNYKIKVFLTRKEEFGDYLQEFETVSKISLTKDNRFDSYFCKNYVGNLKGKYNILVKVYYGQELQKYIDFKLINKNLNSSERNKFSSLKIIDEYKYAFFDKKGYNLNSTYQFYSSEIDMNFKNYYISNLYEIFNNNITFTTLYNYLSSQESERGLIFNGILATNYYYDNSFYKLNYNFKNNTGSKKEYNQLLVKIFRNDLNIDSYKNSNFINNIFNPDLFRVKKVSNIKTYEKMVDNLTSTACENNIIQDPIRFGNIYQEYSELSLLSFCFEKYKNLEKNNFWKDDISLLPVYILDKKTEYKLYFLSEINSLNMGQKWNLLDKITLENLEKGNYLCKITTDDIYLSNSLLENCFILNK